MKKPAYEVFSAEQGVGLTKGEYVFIEVLKSLIQPGNPERYVSMVERKSLMKTAKLITEEIFEK